MWIRRDFAGGEYGEFFVAELTLRHRVLGPVKLGGSDVQARRCGLTEHTGIRAHAHRDTLGTEDLGQGLRGRQVRECREQAPFRFRHAGTLPNERCFYNAHFTQGWSPEAPVLSIRQLCRSFREGGRIHRVLEGLDADIGAGERVAVMGRSGSGKSTLLNLISGIDRADSGAVRIGELEVSALGEPERTLFRRAHIGFVYQFFNLIPTLDVAENVRLVLELNGVRGRAARERSVAALSDVGLRARAHSAIDALSGGEQQRVAIARALVHAPKLLLADEPTGNLDDATAGEVLPVLLRLIRERGTTLVIVTHDEALTGTADRVLELREGRLHPRSEPHRPSAP